MNSLKFAKEAKKSSVSPINTPEKSKMIKKPPQTKRPAIQSKVTGITKKISHAKSLSQLAILEELKQVSVNLVEGFEKLRRITAISKYRPCIEILKAAYYAEKSRITNFIQLKTKYKV